MASWTAQDKTFIITGGASGLGAKYAEFFLQQGAKSIAILDIAESQGKALVEKKSKDYPGALIFIKCDMSKEDDIAKAFEEVVEKFKQIDVIINNAGVMVDSPEVWRTASNVNFQGVVSMSFKGINHMDKSEGGAGGTILNVASTVALARAPMLPVYSGAKIAVLHFTQSISLDPFYATTGVRMLCICFGPTDTPLLHNLERRSYNLAVGKKFQESVIENNIQYQKVESAVNAVDAFLKNGKNGAIWTAIGDRPGKDITPVIDQAFTLLEKEVYAPDE